MTDRTLAVLGHMRRDMCAVLPFACVRVLKKVARHMQIHTRVLAATLFAVWMNYKAEGCLW